MLIRDLGGGGIPFLGGTTSPKNRNFWDIKLTMFGAENFEKFWAFDEKSATFRSFEGKFGQILIIIVILDIFEGNNNSFFDFEKVEKI